jgi:ubiquinone/menaquinone biosynthesis C-methylase UbiE
MDTNQTKKITMEQKDRNKRICPVELAGGLDNSVRRLLQNPQKILKPYIRAGMTVLDLGCGPGFFSVEIAKMVSDSGKVIAADLQDGMLEKVIGVTENVDFVLIFYMIHEVPDQGSLLRELKSILKPGGKIFIIEPNFHVSKKSFEEMTNKITDMGFEILDRPKVFISRAVLLTDKQS